MKNHSLLFFIILLTSCTNRFSEVSIYSNLKEGDSVSVALYSEVDHRYITANGTTISPTDVIRGRVDIALPDSFILKTIALSITVHCYSDSIFTISSIRLKNYGIAYPQDISRSLWWQDGLEFYFDANTNSLKSSIIKNIPGTFPVAISIFFKQSRPIGIQLFLRLSLLATLLILAFIFCKQAPSQHFLLFAIALFLASVPLKTDYTNYTMGLMSLTMIIAFFRNKSGRFVWQPAFYVLCAMYLMKVIGLIYTKDIDLGLKRLDTTVTMILFPVIFSMIQFPKKNVMLLFRFFVWSAIAFCAFGLLSYITIVPELTWDMLFNDSRLCSLLLMWPAHWHPPQLSAILLMAVPAALYLRFQDEKQISLIEMLLGVLLPVVFTLLSGARIGMIIVPVLLGLGYLFYCKFKPALKWGLVVAGIVALCVLFPKVIDQFSDPIRVDLRKTAISAIKEKPVFGWGTGYVEPLILSEERAHSLGIETPHLFNQFHNQYLEDMVQFGIPGIIILLTLFGCMLWIGIRKKNYLLLSLLAIYMLFCWTESALYVAKGIIPFAFWLCFLMTATFSGSDTLRQEKLQD